MTCNRGGFSHRFIAPALIGAVLCLRPWPASATVTPCDVERVNLPALERLVSDIGARHPAKAVESRRMLDELTSLGDPSALADGVRKRLPAAVQAAERMTALQRSIILGDPDLGFGEILLIKRSARHLGLPANFHSNCSLRPTGYDNEVALLSLRDAKARLRTVFKPSRDVFVGDLCLHWDASRFLFSMPASNNHWQVFETSPGGSTPRQVTPAIAPGVHNYDACYLPGGDLLFGSTAACVAVPCVGGKARVANLFRLDHRSGAVRQLCFDQEHNWTPRVLPNGAVLYQRWEYTDTPHSNTRLLMSMNPDGTNQREFYGSNSYWPTSFFYAKPVPGYTTRVVGIATGHHGPGRLGELMVLDSAKGRHEGRGVVQEIPGWGKEYNARIKDPYGNDIWPRFTHPEPVNERTMLVSCQPDARSLRGIYLVDVFDNMLLLKEEKGYAMLEPVPLRQRPVPPVIPNRVNLSREDAVVNITDIYRGPGLAGVPRGAVKALRVHTYTYSYPNVGGLYGVIGMDGPWDMKRVLGTVPVHPDGSAQFRVPANTPLSLQPLDEEGKALALMRSWMTAMPGEVLSCVGCHEKQSETPPQVRGEALRHPPAEIEPWFGPERGFAFEREVQPVLDQHCVSCHDGGQPAAMDLRGGTPLVGYKTKVSGNGGGRAGKFSTAYAALFPYVRGPGIESDYHLLTPMEFHADATELGQLLKKGHYGVNLSREAAERLYTWMDLNTPYHGNWSTIIGREGAEKLENERATLRKLVSGVDVNHENREGLLPVELPATSPLAWPTEPILTPKVRDWPFDEERAKTLQSKSERVIRLGDGVELALVWIPAGEFVMGGAGEHPDAHPRPAQIERGFWMSKFEISNAQYRRFDADHDSKVAIRSNYQFGRRDLDMSGPRQPVVRVSFDDAEQFCQWLSEQAGNRFAVPSETQWEWACRAGTGEDFSFGNRQVDFARYANLADSRVAGFAANTSAGGYTKVASIPNPTPFEDFIPHVTSIDDKAMITADVGQCQPNAWGLHDMHGNAAEWTCSDYESPYGQASDGHKVVRGGSWRSRPRHATAACRRPLKPFHRPFDVGFRVVMFD